MTAVRDGSQSSGVDFSIADLLREMNGAAERSTNLDGLIRQVGGWLEKLLGAAEPGDGGSIWLANFVPEPGGVSVPSLTLARTSRDAGRDPDVASCRFGQGAIGRAARSRSVVNVLTGGPGLDEPEGGWLAPWGPGDAAAAILAVPMVYQERLVGVLCLKRREPRTLPESVVLAAQVLAYHAAQVIHQHQLDQLFAKILDEGECDRVQLAETVARVVGNFIEAPYACVYLWDVLAQCLRLKATTSTILDGSNRELALDQSCYTTPGVGVTRWVFDHKMWLKIDDLEDLAVPRNADQPGGMEAILNQVLRQRYDAEAVASDQVTEVLGSPGSPPGDERPFWKVTLPGRAADYVPQPLWSRQFWFRGSPARSMVLVPILDPWQAGPALGVMLFARPEVAPFSDADVSLLSGLARHIAQAVSRQQEMQAQALERRFIGDVVAMEPSSWKKEFQRRLDEQLRSMREVIGADALVLRVKDGDELTLAAIDPTQEKLQDDWNEPGMVIPGVTYLSIGGSGRAADSKKPIYVASPDHPYRREVAERLSSRRTSEEASFALKIGSEVAVPLMVGDAVIGTMTAVCAEPASQAARFVDGRWVGDLKGVQEQAVHFLQYHSRWLGPALQTIRVMVARPRQMSCLSVAIQLLSAIVDDRKASPTLFRSAALVIATHHEGLGFHQAYIARYEPNSPYPGTQTIRGAGGDAWGALRFGEQDHARRHRAQLESDIQGALNAPDACLGIKGAWKDFHVEVPYLLEAPCLILRKRDKALPHSIQSLVVQHVAKPGDPWSRLLDEFCLVLGVDPAGSAGQQMQLGMVKLRRGANGAPRSLLFVSNVGFAFDSSAYVDPIAVDAVAALQDLGSLLSLAEGVSARVRLGKKLNAIRRKLAELDFDRGPSGGNRGN